MNPPAIRPEASQAAAAEQVAPAVPSAAVRPPVLRKAVNSLAIVPKSAKITALARKAYNVLLHKAQEQGLEQEVYRAPLDSIIKGLAFDSNDYALVKKHLRAMVSTTVEWQSPTAGEGSVWNVCGLLAHARLTKERGQVWVEWSYAVNLKQELLDPAVFARLRLEIVTQLRSHPAVVLYEICSRYRDIGRSSRQPWRWWVPVLTGNPPDQRLDKLEYRIFKRDVLKPAIAEVKAITDLEVALIEHSSGRQVVEIQFAIQSKKQVPLPLKHPAAPVDATLVTKAEALGIVEEEIEDLQGRYGIKAIAAALETTERRAASAYPEPLRDPARYLRAVLAASPDQDRTGVEGLDTAAAVGDSMPQNGVDHARRRRESWEAEWKRRAYERCAAEIEAMPAEAQQQLQQRLLDKLQAEGTHPSIVKRLATSGWRHPLVRATVLRHFGDERYGPGWDIPKVEDLLEIAAEKS